MTKVPKKHLTERYPKSKKIKEALLKRGRLARKIAVCEHDKIDYKTMNLLAKKSIAVIENLAKAVASLEERNKVSEESLIGFLNTAQKMMSEQDTQIKELQKRLEVMRHVN
jgi:TolA-binding protein|tara:strand:+ start:277 stop:609 length:333 start_codon:yes stop_codon:yes gene_type:complete